MAALEVVGDFDKIEELGLGRLVKADAIVKLKFESVSEAFLGSFVVAIATTTHGGQEVGSLERGSEAGSGLLKAPVGMDDPSRRRR